MRTGIYSVVAAVLGVVIGLGMTWWEFRGVHERYESPSQGQVAKAAEPPVVAAAGTAPVAQVEGGTTFDFGVLNPDQTRERKFVIRNQGTAPLEVSWDHASCGMCIQNAHNFTREVVAPGGQCEFIVTYATKKAVPRFDESAYLRTNDPRNSMIQLQITGDIVKAVTAQPESLVFNGLLASEPTKASVRLFGFMSPKLEIVKQTFSNPGLASAFEIKYQPLDDATVKSVEHAQTGLEISLQIKEGLPLGPFNQQITLVVQTDNEYTVDIPITGNVVGDLSVMGPGIDTKQSVLGIGLVNQEKGKTLEFFVLAKGPHRDQVKITASEIDPAEVFQVTVGEPTTMTGGKSIKFPIKLVIPPNSPRMSRYGNVQGKAGRIVLDTNHPFSKQLPLEVRFAIE